jgi:hypothetical protein
MYADFKVKDRWTGEEIHCMYQALIVAISTRHADAVDIKFLASGRPVWIALPHPAWPEYNRRTGNVLTDPLAIEIAGHFLKTAIESGLDSGREMYSLTVEQTLAHLDAVMQEEHAGLLNEPVDVMRPARN